MMTAADAIAALSAAIAAISFLCRSSGWNRKFVGKWRIELAATGGAQMDITDHVRRKLPAPDSAEHG